MFIIADPSFEDVYCKVHVKKSNANKTKLYKTKEIYAPRSSSGRDDASKRSQYIFYIVIMFRFTYSYLHGIFINKSSSRKKREQVI